MRSRAILIGLVAVLLGGKFTDAHAAAQDSGPCPAAAAVVVVDTATHRLNLCRDGRAEHVYRVALGSGGVGKRVAGDRKTPVGAYALSNSRESSRFGLFLPISYPTAEQRQQGYTGGDIGIHGPDRRFAWLSRATVWVDWTAGCIAVSRKSEISEIARWVRTAKAGTIEIR